VDAQVQVTAEELDREQDRVVKGRRLLALLKGGQNKSGDRDMKSDEKRGKEAGGPQGQAGAYERFLNTE
jgi:hypothetical protein